jgi:hypothetical protein
MAHTRAWDVTLPPGSTQAKQIDDEIRKLRVDIDERFADVFVDVLADPVDMKPQFKGNVDGKVLVIPFTDFNSNTDLKETHYNNGFGQAFTDTGPLMAGVKLSPGCIVTKVEVLVDKGDAASVEFDFFARVFAAGSGRPGSQTAQVSLFHGAGAGAGVAIITSGVLAVTILDSQMYYIAIDGIGGAGNSFDFYGARVTYNTPDCRNTV